MESIGTILASRAWCRVAAIAGRILIVCEAAFAAYPFVMASPLWADAAIIAGAAFLVLIFGPKNGWLILLIALAGIPVAAIGVLVGVCRFGC